MKKKFTCMMILGVIATVLSPLLMAQDNTDMKRVSITVRSVSPDGSRNTTTVVKTGSDAEKFNVENYIEQQKKEHPNALIEIDNNGKKKVLNEQSSNNYYYHYNHNYNYTSCDDVKNKPAQGFLGVSQKYSNDKEIEGVRVSITPNSGSANAGLKTDDVLLELNKKPINRFSDISFFMKTTKPGDKVTVTYQRAGMLKTATVTLGENMESRVNVYVKEKEKEACLGVYSSSFAVEGQRGSVIRDFTTVSAAQEVAMQKGDVILSINGVRVQSHQQVWDEIAKYKPKDAVKVAFLRENAPKQVVATLKACKPRNGVDEEKVIVVPKESKAEANSALLNLSPLKLEEYSASPNPTSDMVTVKFKGEALPTHIAFYDANGKLLLQQNIPDFTGDYNQRFDLHELTRGIVIVKVQQGDKVYSNKIIVE